MPVSPLDARELFEDETFAGLDLEGQTIGEREFIRCTFRNLKLGSTRWPASTFEDSLFDDCDLVRLEPAEMRLRGVEFQRCRLMGVDWSGVARNPDLRFVDCNLRYTSFVNTNLRHTEFLRCSLLEAAFIDCEMNEAAMRQCDLSGANFTGCDLTRADLSEAQGLFVDPAKNRVQGLRIPVELAVALAQAAGMKVAGYGKVEEPAANGRARPKRRT